MRNMHNIPTTVILLFFSWLVFIAGTCLAVYFYILDFGNAAQLFKALCLFLSSIFVSALIRAFANLGQLLFDSKQIQEQLNAALLSFQEQFKSGAAETSGSLKLISEQLRKHSDSMSHSFGLLHEQAQAHVQQLSRDLQSIQGQLQEQVSSAAASTSSFQEQGRAYSQQLSRDLKSIYEQLQAQANLISQEVKILKDTVISVISEDVGGLKGNIEQIGCDSRDINEGISQIKTFFELIERHLDLKK